MKKGNVSVEALITVTTFMLFMVFLLQIILGFAQEDIVSQRVFDVLEELDYYHIAHESIGITDHIDDLVNENIKNSIHEDIYESLESYLDKKIFESEDHYLEYIFKSKFTNTDISVESFDIENEIVTVEILHNHNFVFGLHSTSKIKAKKVLFMYGNEPEAYKHHTLVDMLEETLSKEKISFVYKTKSGNKYHLRDCFYINRSTTDHSKVEKISIYDAKYKYFLTYCKRCLGGKNEGW